MANGLIWGIAVIFIIMAIYIRFFKNKKQLCSVTMYNVTKDGVFSRDPKLYHAYEKHYRPEGGEKTIHWVEISGNGKKFVWRPIKFKEMLPTLAGKKNINMAWFGGNDFRILQPKLNKAKYVQEGTDGKFTRVPDNSFDLAVINEEDHYFLAEMYEKLDALYTVKENFFDKYIKPHIALAVVGLFCLLLVYSTSKDVKEMSKMNLETSKENNNMFQAALERLTTHKIDNNTLVTSTPAGGGK